MNETQLAILATYNTRRFDIMSRQRIYMARSVNAKKAAQILRRNPGAILVMLAQEEER